MAMLNWGKLSDEEKHQIICAISDDLAAQMIKGALLGANADRGKDCSWFGASLPDFRWPTEHRRVYPAPGTMVIDGEYSVVEE